MSAASRWAVGRSPIPTADRLENRRCLPDPKIVPAPEHLSAADAVLARLGLEPDGYWVACVGDSEHTAIRNWSPQRWAEALSTWARERGRKFLLVGHQSESKTASAVRE